MKPLANETQAAFFDRCFAAAEGDTDDKTAACLLAWREAKGEDPKAASRFAAECVQVKDRVVFAEHEGRDSDGEVERYDREALVKIVDRCNARIRDTGDYTPISDGHTPTPDEMAAGAKAPGVLGWVGNFRLAKIGNDNPRYAIVADEWHYKDTAGELKRKPRRSVEVWLHDDMGQRYFDPIAALGAVTPKLDLGLRLWKNEHGVQCAKYMADSPAALPGGNNAYVPTTIPKEKERYSAMELSPETLQAIAQAVVAALKATPAEEPAPAPSPEPAPAAEPAKEPFAADEVPAEEPEPKKDEEVEAGKYQKEARDSKAQVAKLSKELADLKVAKDKLVAEKREVVRKAAYAKLAADGYTVNEAEELEHTKTLSDAQFDSHVALLRKNYSKVPGKSNLVIPTADAMTSDEDKIAKAARVAAERVQQYRKEGRANVNYHAELKIVKKEMGLAV